MKIIEGAFDPLLQAFLGLPPFYGKGLPMNVFFVADLNTQGELRQITEYDYATLERVPGASDLMGRCSGELWKNPDQMEVHLSDAGQTLLRWRATAIGA